MFLVLVLPQLPLSLHSVGCFLGTDVSRCLYTVDYSFNLRPNICKSWCLSMHFISHLACCLEAIIEQIKNYCLAPKGLKYQSNCADARQGASTPFNDSSVVITSSKMPVMTEPALGNVSISCVIRHVYHVVLQSEHSDNTLSVNASPVFLCQSCRLTLSFCCSAYVNTATGIDTTFVASALMDSTHWRRSQAYTTRGSDVGPMLEQRLRRWPQHRPSVRCTCLVFWEGSIQMKGHLLY